MPAINALAPSKLRKFVFHKHSCHRWSGPDPGEWKDWLRVPTYSKSQRYLLAPGMTTARELAQKP